METLPLYIPVVSGATTLLTVAFFYKATHGSKTTLLILIAWLALQMFIARTGFYTHTGGLPPRFAFLLFPPLLFIAGLFITRRGRNFIDGLDTGILSLLHVIRIPVEIGLYWLSIHKAVPQLMTFEGTNLDILSGITAPLVFYFGFVTRSLGRKALLVWNFVCLVLLANIVITAILSAPFYFQQLAFHQPNVAVLYFPFVWLPCCVVPLVLFSHLASIRQLTGSGYTLLAGSLHRTRTVSPASPE
ncbi:MAG: hypothetical protein WKF97_11925 [Chitinophagaceae bacterium]